MGDTTLKCMCQLQGKSFCQLVADGAARERSHWIRQPLLIPHRHCPESSPATFLARLQPLTTSILP